MQGMETLVERERDEIWDAEAELIFAVRTIALKIV